MGVPVILACCLRRMRQWTKYPSRLESGYGWWWYKRAFEANRLSTLLVLGCVPVEWCDAAGRGRL